MHSIKKLKSTLEWNYKVKNCRNSFLPHENQGTSSTHINQNNL